MTHAHAEIPTRTRFGGAKVLVLLLVAVYWPTWQAGFIWDDDLHVSANPHMGSAQGLIALWTTSAANYCPLTMTTFWLLHAGFGLNPLAYHLANVALHAGAAILLWWVLRRLRLPGAWLGAAAWALHPVQVESVAWISELKNTQSAVFFLASIGCFLGRWETESTTARRRAYAWSLAWALLAMLSKSSTVMLPAVLWLIAWWRDGRIERRRTMELTPFFLLAALASAWTIWEQKFSSLAQGPDWDVSLAARLAGAGRVFWFYLGKLAWPEPLAFIYPRWTIDAGSLLAWVPLVAALALSVSAWMWRPQCANRRLSVLLAAVCFAVLLFPVMGFFDVYFFRFSFVGDHLQYLASMAPLALLGAGVTIAARKRTIVAGPLLLGALAFSARTHVPQYENNLALFSATVAKNPAAWMAHNNLAAALTDAGRFEEAISHARTALTLRPSFSDAENNLGRALTHAGRPAEALPHLQSAVAQNPADLAAHNNLGLAFTALGRIAEARASFGEVLHRDPAHAGARLNAGLALIVAGDVAGAQREFEQLLARHPDEPGGEMNLGLCLIAQGRTADGLRHLERASRLAPRDPQIHVSYGRGLIAAGRLPDAAEKLATALRLEPRNADTRALLVQLLQQLGRAREAEQIAGAAR